MGPVLFHISISKLDEGIKCTHNQFVDDTTLGRTVEPCEGRRVLLRDRDRQKSTVRVQMLTLYKDKHRVSEACGMALQGMF